MICDFLHAKFYCLFDEKNDFEGFGPIFLSFGCSHNYYFLYPKWRKAQLRFCDKYCGRRFFFLNAYQLDIFFHLKSGNENQNISSDMVY